MGTTSDKLTYLNETKTLLKNKINITGANITNDTFRQYPTKLQNALLDVWNNEGEPIFTNWGTKVNGEGTNVKLDGTLNARMKITPKGNTSQTGTPTPSSPIDINVVSGDNEVNIVGKNLFDTSNYEGNSHTVTQLDTGVKLTNIGNNTYQFTRFYLGKIEGHASETVTLSTTINMVNASACRLYIGVCDSTGNNRTRLNDGDFYSNGNISINATLPSSITSTNNYIFVNLYTSTSNTGTQGGYIEFTNLELNYGTSTTYEPYQSQNYPISLGVENLAINTNTSKTLSGITFTINEDKSITANGTATSNIYYVLRNDLSFKSGETYTLSGCNGGSLSTYYIYCNNIGEEYNGSITKTLTQDYVNRELGIVIKSGYTANNLTFYIQLERGSKANSYTPYNVTPIELNKIGNYQDRIYRTSGKNLFDGEIELGTINAATGELISNNSRTRSKNFIKVKPNTTYYFKGTVTAGNRWIIGYKADKTAITDGTFSSPNPASVYSIFGGYAGDSFTTTATTEYIKWYDTASTDLTEKVMIELGSTATTYEPYGSGKWYLHKEVGKIVVNGSGVWSGPSADGGTSGVSGRYYYTHNLTNFISSMSSDTLYNNYFPSVGTTYGNDSTNLQLGNSYLFIRLKYSELNITTLADFKTWLSTHNVNVYYQLQTPTETEITNTTLINQLEALKGAMSYEGQTNINGGFMIIGASALGELS